MSDISPTTPDRLLEALRQRERLLETEMACIMARLSEVQDLIATVTSRPRGRPRNVRAVEPQPELLQQQPEPPEAA